MDKIIQGDCFELVKTIPDNTINLVITSPPYFNQRTYTDNPQELGKEKSIDTYLDKLNTLFSELIRVLCPTGSIIINIGDKYVNGNLQLIPYRFAIQASAKAKLVNNIVWNKLNPTPRQFKKRLVSSHEPFFHFVKTDDYYYKLPEEPVKPKKSRCKQSKYFDLIEKSNLTETQKWQATKDLCKVISEVNHGELYDFRMKIRDIHSMPFGGQEGGRKSQILNNGYTIIRIHGKKLQKDVLDYPVESVKWNTHPAIYPVGIVEKFLNMLTKEDDLVLDPFMGSGTTAVVCKKLNRRYLGFELCQEFIKNARV